MAPEEQLGDLPQASNQPLPDGQAGNLQTVQVMRGLAHQAAGDPLVQQLASSIILPVPSHHYLDEAKAIGRYVQSKVRYRMDPDGYEQLQAPALLIQNIQKGTAQGDCDDMALLTSALLLAIGHTPSYCMVRYEDDAGGYNHIYVADTVANGRQPPVRVALDCIVKDQPIGYEVTYQSGDEVEV
jgi:hypothetical protein